MKMCTRCGSLDSSVKKSGPKWLDFRTQKSLRPIEMTLSRYFISWTGALSRIETLHWPKKMRQATPHRIVTAKNSNELTLTLS